MTAANSETMAAGDCGKILAFLEEGTARLESKGDTLVLRRGKERGTSLVISASALAALASKGLLVRDGANIALGNREGATAASRRRTERIVLEDAGTRRTVERVRAESPLDLLRARRDRSGAPFLTASQHAAGDRLRGDFTRAHMMPGIGMRWSHDTARSTRNAAGGSVELTEGALAARQRVNRALDAVGPELSGLLVDVCCFLKGLETVEAERGWPQRSAKVVLRVALSVLARHYAPETRTQRATRHWGADDYRPGL